MPLEVRPSPPSLGRHPSVIKLSSQIKNILNKSKMSSKDKNSEFITVTERIFKDSHNRTMEEINLLRKFLNRKKTPIKFKDIESKSKKIDDDAFHETKVEINRIVNKELREKEELRKKQYEKNFGEFEMPKVKAPNFSHRSSSQIQAELAKVPFKCRITNYCGEDQAYFRFKNNTLLQKEDSPDIQKILPEISQNVMKIQTENLELKKIISKKSSRKKKLKKLKIGLNKSTNLELDQNMFDQPKMSLDYSTNKGKKMSKILDSGESKKFRSIDMRAGSMFKTPVNTNTKRLREKSSKEYKKSLRYLNRSVVSHPSKVKLPAKSFLTSNEDFLKNPNSKSKKKLGLSIIKLAREVSKESLENRDKVNTIITECDNYRKKDRVSPIKKLEHERFLENYYQTNFNETVNLMKKFKTSDPNILLRFYNYETIKRDEEMVRVAEVAKKYKKDITDPCRTLAVLERIGNAHKGNPHL
ncbi:unnamed protein product [Moneuplotes crassus]|uniref:Uncharacterized protein n=1 Tax=Euplotes crassus TaxID=5936 RepID=A0AAD1UCR0_EUPCR|nr:unnamed protein product [Moneuplotes crassus]